MTGYNNSKACSTVHSLCIQYCSDIQFLISWIFPNKLILDQKLLVVDNPYFFRESVYRINLVIVSKALQGTPLRNQCRQQQWVSFFMIAPYSIGITFRKTIVVAKKRYRQGCPVIMFAQYLLRLFHHVSLEKTAIVFSFSKCINTIRYS